MAVVTCYIRGASEMRSASASLFCFCCKDTTSPKINHTFLYVSCDSRTFSFKIPELSHVGKLREVREVREKLRDARNLGGNLHVKSEDLNGPEIYLR